MKQRIFAEDILTHRLYIKAKYSGISVLVLLVDGLPISSFGKKPGIGPAYLSVEDVIAWHEKELRETNGRGGNAEIVAKLKARLSGFQAEHEGTPLCGTSRDR